MSLPTSRNTTYAASSQVLSADLNDIQDKIIDNYANAYPSRRISVLSGQATGSGAFNLSSGVFTSASTSDLLGVPLPVVPGTRLTAVRAAVKDTATSPGYGATITMHVVKRSDTPPSTQSSSSLGTDTSDESGNVQILEVSGLTEDIPDNDTTPMTAYFAYFTFGDTGQYGYVYSIEIEWEPQP